MGSEAQPAGKTWWEQQRTGLSRLIAVLAFLVVALTESRWELHQEPVAIFLFSIGLPTDLRLVIFDAPKLFLLCLQRLTSPRPVGRQPQRAAKLVKAGDLLPAVGTNDG